MRGLVSLPLRNGTLMTFVPDDANAETATDFRHGGLAVGTSSGVIGAINEKVATLIAHHLSGGPAHYAIFEDYLREPDSKLLAGDHYFVHQNEVCLFISPGTGGDPHDIKRALKNASRYTFRGILTSLGSNRELMVGESVAPAVLAELAQNSKHILVGAYDEESYIIWSREGCRIT